MSTHPMIEVFDTTLRDGLQVEGVSATVDDKLRIADVPSNKNMTRVALQRSQVRGITGVGELVEVNDGCGLRLDPVKNEIRANETGTAGNEDGVFHKFRNHDFSRIYTNGERKVFAARMGRKK